jgi:hypothetical protein
MRRLYWVKSRFEHDHECNHVALSDYEFDGASSFSLKSHAKLHERLQSRVLQGCTPEKRAECIERRIDNVATSSCCPPLSC